MMILAFIDKLGGVYAFDLSRDDYQYKFQQWIKQAARYEVSALMCHPASHHEAAQDGIAAARYAEYQALMSMNVAQLTQQNGVTLARVPH
ncbi:MAG: hypothetical protein ACKODS_02765 [Methylophilaceae bacterium]